MFSAKTRKALYIGSAVVALAVAVIQAYFTGSAQEQPPSITGVLAALAVLGAGINAMAAANTVVPADPE